MSGDGAAIVIEENGGTWRFGPKRPLVLDSGARIDELEIAYKTYGRLNEERSNAVLVCHALTLDQHVASVHPTTGKPGWWTTVVGPGLPLEAPGAGLPDTVDDVEPGYANFLAVVIVVRRLEWLRLAHTGNLSARLEWDGAGGLSATWIVP